jgi:hypothetical protein
MLNSSSSTASPVNLLRTRGGVRVVRGACVAGSWCDTGAHTCVGSTAMHHHAAPALMRAQRARTLSAWLTTRLRAG